VAVRCLIIDDNHGFLEVARTLLEQEGLQIVGVASTGADAVESAAELRPDVTLVDIDLGAESGFVVARWLDDDPDVDPGALILISSHAEEDLAELIEASPAIGFLAKPALSATAIDRLIRAADGGHDRPGETVQR
jgi:DNA-binding NarL/FixJ family response regulator